MHNPLLDRFPGVMAGLAGGFVRSPLIELSPDDRNDLQGILTRTGLLTGLLNAQRIPA